VISVPVQVVGLDPSLTGFGIAASSGEGLTALTRLTTKLRGHERLEFLLAELSRLIKGADLAVMEGLSFAAKGNALLDLAGLHWMCRQTLWESGIPYAIISPSQLKKFATGDSAADKMAMVIEAVRRFPSLEIRDSDTADSLWALAAGCQHVGRPLCSLPQDRIAVLDAVHADKGRRGQPKIIWPEIAVATPMAGSVAMF
jgi:Holliday junction resolvasome RuvABC endonuclease subunit